MTSDDESNDEKRALTRHLRERHPNLLDSVVTWADMRRGLEADRLLVFQPGLLPSSGLSDVPFLILATVHRAAHEGLYVGHEQDDWLRRDHDKDGEDPGSGLVRPAKPDPKEGP